MHFFSDNATPVCPEVMAAIAAADRADHGYDGDAWSARLDDAFSTLFETEVQALWVASGTAANSIALACLCPPYGGVIAHEEAHIVVDECGAPGFFTHGATLMPLPGVGAKLTPDSVRDRLKTIRPDVHQVPARAISITNATEYGLVYAPEEVAALGDVAKAHDLGLHMDGARFANAVAHLGCAPADLTWRAGVNALSFGCVKNGGMIGEALLFFGAQAQDRVERDDVLRAVGQHDRDRVACPDAVCVQGGSSALDLLVERPIARRTSEELQRGSIGIIPDGCRNDVDE